MNLNEYDTDARADELTLEERLELLEEQNFDLSQLLIRQDYQLAATQAILKTLLTLLSERAILPSSDVQRQVIYQLSQLAQQSDNPTLSEEFGQIAEQFFPDSAH
ncbi:hypothetical protein [Caviibacterium pharyngocola]|uniref:Uncharacterized protein n=1 Tax=Caviibacterium pharyngocola TaxID=28159 RepID=A0A2M8RTD8_9PAST|nr:hypothetical protein [Caviibacterium pharyngocola]PJG82147.1 hypothetical protein CVP04_10855 [Caviibacterium pharyngocola]